MMEAEGSKPSLGSKALYVAIGIPIACVVVGGAYYFYQKGGKKSSEHAKEDLINPDSVSLLERDKQGIENDEDSSSPAPDAQAFKSRGNKFFKGTKFEKAIECYTKAIELCAKEDQADLSTFYQNRAAANEQLQNWSAVVSDCTSAIELNPKYSKALHRRAKAYEALDRKRDCLEDVTAVCLLDGFQNQQCMILADRILKTIGKDLAAEHFQVRPRSLPSGTFIKSYLDSFNTDVFAVPMESEEEDPTYYSIKKCMENRDYESVLNLCTENIENNGKFVNQAVLLRGTIKTLMCDIEGAVVDFDQILALEEDDETTKALKIDALIKRASLKMQQADDTGCYADLGTALKIDGNNANIYHHRGQLYFLTDRLEEAKQDFQKAMSVDSQFVAPRIQLGYCLCKIAMQAMSPSIMKEANDILDETTQLFPKSTEAWSLYGQLLQDQQRLDEASSKLDKAISLSPNTPTTYVYKALLLLQWKQDLDGANKLIRKAIELDDKCDFAYETLATLEVQKGNNDEAIRLFERSIELVRTEAEMANTFSLLEAAKAQAKVTKQYGIKLPENPGLM